MEGPFLQRDIGPLRTPIVSRTPIVFRFYDGQTRPKKLSPPSPQNKDRPRIAKIESISANGLCFPVSSYSYTPELGEAWFRLAFAVTRQERLTLREKELAVLAVLAEYDAPYVRYAHSQIAVGAAAAGFSRDEVQQAVRGRVPATLSDERERAVYGCALELARLRAPMGAEAFERAAALLGRERLAGLVHVVSGFVYVAMLTNVSDSGVPAAKEGAFVAER